MRALETPIDIDWRSRQSRRLRALADAVYAGVVDPWFEAHRTTPPGKMPEAYYRAEQWALVASDRISRSAVAWAREVDWERLEALEAKRMAALRRLIAEVQQ